MSEVRMALSDTDLRRIGDYVKVNMYGWLLEVVAARNKNGRRA